jgi:hypothetical protein
MKRKPRSTSPEAIAKRNAAFAKLSPEQKRVTVAKDVIAALNAKQIKAQANYYLKVYSTKLGPKKHTAAWYAEMEKQQEADAQTELLAGKLQCSACAIGAVFTCAVERVNNLKVEDLKSARKSFMSSYLEGLFSREQLDLMEVAFERTSEHAESLRDEDGYYTAREHRSAVDSAIDFGRQFESDEWDKDENKPTFDADGCMRAIMKNVSDNNGEFRP